MTDYAAIVKELRSGNADRRRKVAKAAADAIEYLLVLDATRKRADQAAMETMMVDLAAARAERDEALAAARDEGLCEDEGGE